MPAIPELADLTLEQRIGQTLCFGWQRLPGEPNDASLTASTHAHELVETMQVGSLVLMGRNVSSEHPEQTRQVLTELQAASSIPLFIAIDQEGGVVNRLRHPFHEFPGNMALGAITEGAEEYARRQAEAQARELRALGINWNFAPCVDVNCNPDNPIIGVRSYGEDPHLVARLGSAAMHGYQKTGLLACAKHFPGHGDTNVDSHLALPTIQGGRDRLDSVELVPFRALIREGVGAIMTTHILFPALDAERPATLSPAILTGLLRTELGYDGLVITDCLEMEAIAGTIGTPQGAVEALKAGADIVLVCHTLETQRATVQAIHDALVSGELPEERLNEAVGRVLTAKRRFMSDPSPVEEAPWLDPAHDALEEEIARASITVVRSNDALPLNREKVGIPCIVSLHRYSVHDFAKEMQRYSRRDDRQVDVPDISSEFPQWKIDQVLQFAFGANRHSDPMIVVTVPYEPWSQQPIDQEKQAQLVRELRAIYDERLIVVALREPYDLRRFPDVANYICTYGYRPASLRALADALFGVYEPTGELPVTIPL